MAYLENNDFLERIIPIIQHKKIFSKFILKSFKEEKFFLRFVASCEEKSFLPFEGIIFLSAHSDLLER